VSTKRLGMKAQGTPFLSNQIHLFQRDAWSLCTRHGELNCFRLQLKLKRIKVLWAYSIGPEDDGSSIVDTLYNQASIANRNWRPLGIQYVQMLYSLVSDVSDMVSRPWYCLKQAATRAQQPQIRNPKLLLPGTESNQIIRGSAVHPVHDCVCTNRRATARRAWWRVHSQANLWPIFATARRRRRNFSDRNPHTAEALLCFVFCGLSTIVAGF
jgi:hypothetical protein